MNASANHYDLVVIGTEALEATVDLAVHAPGRRPAVELLGLEAGGAALRVPAERVERGQTRLPLTPVASLSRWRSATD